MKKIILGAAGLGCIAASICVILVVPPTNDLVVFGLISAVSLAAFFLIQLLFPFKYSLLGFCSVFTFLTINYLVGLQILNTALLLSVIIGIAFLLKKNHSHE